MSYRVTYPCGNGDVLCHEDFDDKEEALVSAGVRRMQLRRWAKAGIMNADDWQKVEIQEVKDGSA